MYIMYICKQTYRTITVTVYKLKTYNVLCKNYIYIYIYTYRHIDLCVHLRERSPFWIWSQESLVAAAAAAKSLQLCPTLCDPIDGSPQGSPVPGILQARTLEWVAISFFNAWKWKVKVKSLSHVRLFTTPWTAAHQAAPSMGFSRQEYWSGVPLPSPSEKLSNSKSNRSLD